jgi:hydrogenase maturation protease
MDDAIPTRSLIIAYGNPLRSDDGIGWHAAELLRRELTPSEAEVVCVHQLAPELAEAAGRADKVIFIDAACNGTRGEIVCAEVHPAARMVGHSHLLSPDQVIALCQQLYRHRPRAFTVSVTGESFEHGEALSQTVANALMRLVETVSELIVGEVKVQIRCCSRSCAAAVSEEKIAAAIGGCNMSLFPIQAPKPLAAW